MRYKLDAINFDNELQLQNISYTDSKYTQRETASIENERNRNREREREKEKQTDGRQKQYIDAQKYIYIETQMSVVVVIVFLVFFWYFLVFFLYCIYYLVAIITARAHPISQGNGSFGF